MSRTQVSASSPPIRPARTADLPALGDFFAGLSVQARYLRFFSPITPGPALLRLLCGGDGSTDALLATRDGVIIGHGMAADVPGRAGPGRPISAWWWPTPGSTGGWDRRWCAPWSPAPRCGA